MLLQQEQESKQKGLDFLRRIIMSKISLEDYEKLEKFNLEQQKALRENAMVIANLEMEKIMLEV